MKVNYCVKGEGRTIILLHGWGGSIGSLEKLQQELADMGFQVFNLDLPGFGDSGIPGKAMTLDDYVEYLDKLVTRLNIYKPIFVGHSFGGKLAMKYAINKPGTLSNLVVIDASGINPRNSAKRSLLYLPAKIFGAVFDLPGLKLVKPIVRKLFYKFVVREHDYVKSDHIRQTFQNIISEHLDGKLDQIKTDTLVIWGEKDTVTPLWQGQQLASKIAGSRFEVVEGAKHSLPLEMPEVVARIIYSYLNN
ncbi:MAG: alpha/beta fold hydrolase [Candidatus Dojkabacteria bacterium]